MSGGPAWSEDEDERLRTLWSEGHKIADIVEKIPGRSRSAIAMRRKKLGIPGRPQVPKQTQTKPDVLTLLDRARLGSYSRPR